MYWGVFTLSILPRLQIIVCTKFKKVYFPFCALYTIIFFIFGKYLVLVFVIMYSSQRDIKSFRRYGVDQLGGAGHFYCHSLSHLERLQLRQISSILTTKKLEASSTRNKKRTAVDLLLF